MQTSTAPGPSPALEEELAALGVRAPIHQPQASVATATAVAGPGFQYTAEHYGNGVPFGNGVLHGNGMDADIDMPAGINLEEAR